LKCSTPKEFNDPYELFLTIDFTERPELLAFYQEVIGALPQLPTTCFSRSPIVIPMWAHYAEALQGVVIEFDQRKLEKSFPNSGFGDVDYRDAPDEDLGEMLYRAYEIGKPRYLYMLRQGLFSAAYYSKATCWTYENERRMILRASETRTSGRVTLVDVPRDCVTSVICGPRASTAVLNAVRTKARQLKCKCFELRIGRSSPEPFLVDSNDCAFVFDGRKIKRSQFACGGCKEPLATDKSHCSWCQIDESHTEDAASRNIFRAFAHLGMLEKYIADMNNITFGSRRK
jgi:hypothetical protein